MNQEATPAGTAHSLVTRLFATVDGRKWDDLPSVFAPDCVIERAEQQLVGLDRIIEWYRHERRFTRTEHRPERIVSDLDAAACWGTFTATTVTGETVRERFADTLLVREGRIVRRATHLFPKSPEQ